MKKKNRFLINIALLALSLCIMVYGVYSAKQASLTVSGTIGFTAHNGQLSVQLTGISGAYDVHHNEIKYDGSGSGQLTSTSKAATTVSGKVDLKIESAATNGAGESNTDAQLKALYFDDVKQSTATEDIITDIVLTFTVKNQSMFAMKIDGTSLTGTTGTDNRVSYTITLPASNSMAAATSTGGNDGGSVEFTITLALSRATSDTGNVVSSLVAGAFNVPVAFVKA